MGLVIFDTRKLATGVLLVGAWAAMMARSDSTLDYAVAPAVITVTGYDQTGELVEQHYDADPMARFDIWPTGEGDANFDGKVDLVDLNLVLANMGKEYR